MVRELGGRKHIEELAQSADDSIRLSAEEALQMLEQDRLAHEQEQEQDQELRVRFLIIRSARIENLG